MTTGWVAGLSRRDITAWEPSMAMLGWGVFTHRVEAVAERLHVRALVLRRPSHGEVLAIASLDLGIVPQRLSEAVCDHLAAHHPGSGLGRASVMLVATHTHAAPDGITDSLLYGASNLGFSPVVFGRIVERVVEALLDAHAACVPAAVSLGRATVPRSAPVMFNRSLAAWLANADVRPVDDARDAVDRDLTVLRVADASGVELGLVVFLASHGTLIHADTPTLHPDHPGMAARAVERRRGRVGRREHVTVMVQSGAGDVTPNHRPSPRRGFTTGVDDEDHASAAQAGLIFAHTIGRAADDAARALPLRGTLSGTLRYVDMTAAEVAPLHGGGRARTTRPPRLGLAFTLGTAEGPGPFSGLYGWIHRLHALRRWRGLPDVAYPFGDFGIGLRGGLLFGLSIRHLASATRVDPVIAWFYAVEAEGLLQRRSWVPTRLPVQVLRLGSLVIGGVAAEPTTVAARRFAATLRRSTDAADVCIAGYANAYAGYITTPEEYGMQRYEGGHTLFGPWTWGAWATALDLAAAQGGGQVIGARPEIVDLAHLLREREVGRAALGRLAPAVQAQRLGDLRT